MTATPSAVADVRASDAMLGLALGLGVSCAWVLAVSHIGGGAPDDHADETRVAVKVAAVSRPASASAPARRSERPPRRKRSAAPSEPELPPAPPVRDEPEPDRHHDHDRKSGSAASAIDDLPSPEAADDEGPALPGVLDEPEGEGEPGGDAEGEAAVAAYRATLRRWLAARYRVRGSDLPEDELAGKKVHLVLRIDPGRTVIGTTLTPTGADAFDRAAFEGLDALEGEVLPAPPPSYPGPLQSRLRVTFICKRGACD